ncbi:MAG: 30S ribosomal protein S8 [Victivallaceae bacterium]|nr:30S ribosomal protein S8 [Victivallaceae bacterium]
MSMQDPVADMLTRIRNAGSAGLVTVSMPGSKMKAAIAQVLQSEGYIAGFQVVEDGVKKVLSIDLKYYDKKPVIEGIERVSKPSCRIYCQSTQIPKVRNGLGTVVLSTPDGILSGRVAAKKNVGGEILCYVW